MPVQPCHLLNPDPSRTGVNGLCAFAKRLQGRGGDTAEFGALYYSLQAMQQCSAVQYLRQLTAAMYEYRCSPERYEASVAEHPRGAQASVRWTGDGARGGSGGWGVYRNAALEYLRAYAKA